MGCVSSKMVLADLRQERKFLCSSVCSGGGGGGGGGGGVSRGGAVASGGGDYPNHIVSLTSSTYGLLKLDRDDVKEEGGITEEHRVSQHLRIPPFHMKVPMEEPEIINAWELMEDLEDDIPMYSPVKKTQAKPNAEVKTFDNIMESPRKQKKKKNFAGKENLYGAAMDRPDSDPASVLKPLSSSDNRQGAAPVTAVQFKSTPINLKIQVSRGDNGFLQPRKSLSPAPLFDPALLASFEEGLREEEEQIKKMVSPAPRNRKAREAAASLLESFEKKCPPGGEDAVVLYTTTLRGIRRTFEDCNAVREAVESYGVRVVERDVSMDSGFREELRVLLTGKKGARVPVLFVKGRLVGGADEVLKLEDEGKLGAMLAGMPSAAACCDGCRGFRFVLCMDCSGGRKVFDEVEGKMVKCEECNENGLIHCPICC